jgi:hypothetical protein
VSEDWEATTGLTHDLFHVADASSEEVTSLREQFKNVPMLLKVMNVLLELDQGTSLRKRKRAHHHTLEYTLDGGKLWRVATGHHVRACTGKGRTRKQRPLEMGFSEEGTT